MINLFRQNKISKWFSGIGASKSWTLLGCAALSLVIPTPFNANWEKGYLANTRLDEKLEELLAY